MTTTGRPGVPTRNRGELQKMTSAQLNGARRSKGISSNDIACEARDSVTVGYLCALCQPTGECQAGHPDGTW